MKEKIFNDKISTVNDIEAINSKIKQSLAELEMLKCRDKLLDKQIADELQINLTNEYTLNNYKFTLDREVTTTILKSKRQDAIKYNNKFGVGIFALTIQGMKLKSWVKDILAQKYAGSRLYQL